MQLDSEDHKAIAAITVDALVTANQKMWVDRETHYNHHQWVEEKKADEELNRDFKRKIIQAGVVWALFPILGFVVWAVAKAAIEYINHQGPTP